MSVNHLLIGGKKGSIMLISIKIDEILKARLDVLKAKYVFKSYDETIDRLLTFVQQNNFDLTRNYQEDWHNIIEKSNDKSLKRIEDVIRIIRNIEKDSILPIRTQVYDMYNNSDVNFKNDVIQEVKKDMESNATEKLDVEKYKIELAQLKKSRDVYFNELNNLRPLINELLNSLTIKNGIMGSKIEVAITPERLTELKQQINK